MGAMIAGRAMQGLGGGLLTALAYAMIPLLFPEALRPRAIALVSSVWGAAALGGPLVGGAFAEFGLWRGAFAVGLPAAGCVALLAERVLPPGAGDAPRGPLPGLPGLRLALIAGAALALSAGGLPGRLWASALGIIASLTLLTAAVRLDRRAARRLLPRGAFDPRVPAGSVVAMMGLMVLGFGTAPFVPYVLRMAHGASPVLAGYVVAAASLAWTLASFATAGASPERVRLLLALAPAVMAAAFLGVAASIAAGQAVPLVAVFWALVGSAVGIGWAHLASLLIASVPADERPLAAAFVTTLQIAATAFGAALAGLVSNLAGLAVATTPDEVASAARWLFAAFAAPLAALPTLVRLRSLVRATSAGPG
jgi:MFS family permease